MFYFFIYFFNYAELIFSRIYKTDMEIDMTHDFTVYLVNTILKTILGFRILDIRIHEIFLNIKIIAIEYHKIDMTPNTAIMKGNNQRYANNVYLTTKINQGLMSATNFYLHLLKF